MSTPHACPFVRAVLAGDDLEVERLNRADGNPAEPAVVEVLRSWARNAGKRAELEAAIADNPDAHRVRLGSARGK